MASHATTSYLSQNSYLLHATQKLKTLSSSSVTTKASWDTQKRLPYNPNAPRKLKNNTLTTKMPTSTSSPSLTSSSSLTLTEKHVSDLLKRNSPETNEGISWKVETELVFSWLFLFILCAFIRLKSVIQNTTCDLFLLCYVKWQNMDYSNEAYAQLLL